MQAVQGTNSGHRELIVKSKNKSNPLALCIILFLASFAYLLIYVNKVFAILFGILVVLSTILDSISVKLPIGKKMLLTSIIVHLLLVFCLGLTLDLSNYYDIIAGICFYLSALGMTLFGNKQKDKDYKSQQKKKNE